MLVLLLLLAQTDPNTCHIRRYEDLPRLVNKADEHAAAGRWREVVEIYADALETSPDALVPVDGNDRFVSVFSYCMQKLGRAPEAAREAYRLRFDGPVRDRLTAAREARDAAALQAIIAGYPYCSYVAEAGLALAAILLDDGRVDEAADALETLWASKSPPRARAAAQLATALQLAGRAERLKALQDELAADAVLAAASVTVAGRERNLLDYVRGLEPRPRAAALAPIAVPDQWPMIGGSASGPAVVPDRRTLPPLEWEAQLPPADTSEEWDLYGRPSRRRAPPSPPLCAAVADGMLFVHNEYHVRAYSLYARRPVELWSHSVPAPLGELMMEETILHGATVDRGRVFVNLVVQLGLTVRRRGSITVTYPFPKRRLVALDQFTGRVLWTFGADDDLRDVSVPLPPTTDGRYLYVGLVEQDLPTSLFSHFVACLDPENGRVLWKTFVASGNTEINLFGNSIRESIGSPVAVRGDLVFYCTNHGAIAALQRQTGRPKWVYRYRQWAISPTRTPRANRNYPEWHNGPMIADADALIVAPADARHFFGLKPDTGEPLWKPRTRDDLARYLLGRFGDRVVFGGEDVYAYDIGGGREPRLAWCAGLMGNLGSQGAGRGAISAGRVYQPTERGVAVIDLRDGRIEDERSYQFERSGLFMANGAFLGDALVLSGLDRVAVCIDRASLRERVEAIASKPDPRPEELYEAALKAAYVSGADEARKLLEKVRDRTQNSTHPTYQRIHASAGQHLFAHCVSTAQALLAAGDHDGAAALLRQALKEAVLPSQQTLVSWKLAAACATAASAGEAVAILQDLVKKQGDARVEEGVVRDVARDKIDELIRKFGPEVYAAVEREAVSGLARATTPEQMLEVARTYPNSAAGAKAQTGAVLKFLDREDVARGFDLTWWLLTRRPPSASLANVGLDVVEILEKRDMHNVARAILRLMAERMPEVETGRGVLRKIVADKLASAAYAAPPAPAPTPIRAKPELVARSEAAVLAGAVPVPTVGASPRLLVATGTTLRALSPEDLSVAWSTSLTSPPETAGVFGDRLAVVAAREVVGVALADGRELWRRVRLPGAEAQAVLVAGGLVTFAAAVVEDAESFDLTCLDGRTGLILWTTAMRGTVPDRLDRCGDTIALITYATDPQLVCVDAYTGTRRQVMPLSQPAASYEVVDADDFTITLFNPFEGLKRWHVPRAQLKWAQLVFGGGGDTLVAQGGGRAVLLSSLLGAGDGKLHWDVSVVNAASGKLEAGENLAIPRTPQALAVVGNTAVVATGEDGELERVEGFRLPKFTPAWTLAVAEEKSTMLSPPVADGAHAIVPILVQKGDRAEFELKVWIVSADGKIEKTIEGGRRCGRPPVVATTADGGLWIQIEKEVQYWK